MFLSRWKITKKTSRIIRQCGNPAKNELRRLSKFIIQAVNKKLRHKLNLNQWKNTEDVIDKFKSINDKQHCKFERIITQTILRSCWEVHQRFQWRQSHRQTCKKVSAFQDQKRKWTNWCDDGCIWWCRGLRTCWNFYTLSALTQIQQKQHRFIQRWRLAVFRNISGPQTEKIKKHFQNIFRKNNIKILVCILK